MTIGRAMSIAPDGTRVIHSSLPTIGRNAPRTAASLPSISEDGATPAAAAPAPAPVAAAASSGDGPYRPSAADAFAPLGKGAAAPLPPAASSVVPTDAVALVVAPSAAAAPAPLLAVPAPGAGLAITGITNAPAAGSMRSFNSFQGLSCMSWARANPFTRLVTIAAICNRSRFSEGSEAPAGEAAAAPAPSEATPAEAGRQQRRKRQALKKPGVDFGEL
jgi:hypothetical protein